MDDLLHLRTHHGEAFDQEGRRIGRVEMTGWANVQPDGLITDMAIDSIMLRPLDAP